MITKQVKKTFLHSISQIYRGTPDVILMVRNAAVLEGKRIPLHCNTADEEYFLNIVWLKYKHLISDGSVDTVDGGVIIGYSSSVTNKALCDRCRFLTLTWTNTLYVENANVSDAGVYSCIKTATSTTTYGHVTILRHPECQQPPATPVIANTRMEYSCSVCVTGRGVPSMQWNVTALPHTSAQRDTVLSGPFVCSSATLRVDASPERNGFTFECRLTFVVPLINVSNYARNAPGYHYTFTTTLLSVLYAPTFLKVTPLRRTYDVGDTVTANTDGNPIATISWFDSGTLSAIETGRTMPVTPDFAGRCYVIAVKAVNPLGGLSATLRFRVPAVNFSATTSAGGGYNGSSRNVTSGKPLPATAVPPRTGDNAAKRRIVRKILTFVVLPLILLVLVTSVCHVIRKSRTYCHM
ncbi:hypothetical protein LSAT2_000997 [Lamellibrachia satsuma]|nr:hypothetical protein LSAT2_000997 [Lamellibrachia satsuma]